MPSEPMTEPMTDEWAAEIRELANNNRFHGTEPYRSYTLALLAERDRLKAVVTGGNMVIGELKEDVAYLKRLAADYRIDVDRLKADNEALLAEVLVLRKDVP